MPVLSVTDTIVTSAGISPDATLPPPDPHAVVAARAAAPTSTAAARPIRFDLRFIIEVPSAGVSFGERRLAEEGADDGGVVAGLGAGPV